MRITWANHSKRWIFVSNVSMTYDGLCELNTSDWFPCVWTLPQNRWRHRRLHILKDANPIVVYSSNMAAALLSPFFFGPFARLFFNLAMCIRALFPKSATIFWLVEQALWRMPLSTEWSGASSFLQTLHGNRAIFPLGLLPLGLLVLDAFHTLLRRRSRRRGSAVSFLHVYWYRDWNCNCLLENTVRWLSTVNNLLEFLVHAVLSPDSWLRRSFQNFRFWLPNSWFVDSARYFFSPLSSICDNQVQLSSDESPSCTIPMRSWVSQTLVFLILYNPSKMSSDGIFVIDNNIPSHLESNSWISSFRRAMVNRSV